MTYTYFGDYVKTSFIVRLRRNQFHRCFIRYKICLTALYNSSLEFFDDLESQTHQENKQSDYSKYRLTHLLCISTDIYWKSRHQPSTQKTRSLIEYRELAATYCMLQK